MKRKRNGAKNDVLFGIMMFAMFAVMVFNVAAEYFGRYGANLVLIAGASSTRAATT